MVFLLTTIFIGFFPLALVYLLQIQRAKSVVPAVPFLMLVFFASLYEFVGSYYFEFGVKYWFVVYNILVFIVLHYFYYKLLHQKFKFLFYGFALAFLALCFYLFVNYDLNNTFVFSSYSKVLQTIIILTFSALWFKDVFEKLEISNLLQSPSFYFVSGLILYYCSTVFLFLMHDLLYGADKSEAEEIWLLNIIFNLLLRSLLIIGVWKAKTK
jgi:hypothetical protein